MAIVQSIAVGKARGSAGNVSFSTVKGRVIMREKPIFVSNPRTDAQQNQRSSFAKAIKLWQLVGFIASAGWTRVGSYCSAYNQFVSSNMAFVKELPGTVEDVGIQDLMGLQISSGDMPQCIFELDGANLAIGQVSVSAIIPAGSYKVGDKICFVLYDKSKTKPYFAETVLNATHISNGSVQMDVVVDNGTVEAYLLGACYALSADGKSSSTTYF